jgi:hypothetical protein
MDAEADAALTTSILRLFMDDPDIPTDFRITPKGVRMVDLLNEGVPWGEALAQVEREFDQGAPPDAYDA